MRVIRFILSFIVCGLFTPATSHSQTKSFQSLDELSEWMSYYYIDKDFSRVPDFLHWFQSSKLLDTKDHILHPTCAHLSVIFAAHPELVGEWLEEVAATDKLKEAIKIALQMSGQGFRIMEIYGETQSNRLFDDTSLLDMPILGGGDLDMMWSAFMASGDTRYVSRIIDVLDYSVGLTGDQKLDGAIRQSALWSLKSNMKQHELVHRCIKKEIDNRTGELQKLLIETEKMDFKSTNPFPYKDGEFSGMLLLTDESQLSEYNKPSYQGMYFKDKDTAKRGEALAVKVIFKGMQLNEELFADVTYDLKVIDPKGKLYDSTDLKDLVASKMKHPTRFAVFDSRDFITIRFEPEDKLGTYKFVTKLRDNLGGKAISFTKEVTLTK